MWHSAEMAPIVTFAAEQTSWHDIPGVQVVGAVLGILLLIAALRAMFR